MSTDKTPSSQIGVAGSLGKRYEMQTRHKNLVSPFCVGDEVARKAALSNIFQLHSQDCFYFLNDDDMIYMHEHHFVTVVRTRTGHISEISSKVK